MHKPKGHEHLYVDLKKNINKMSSYVKLQDVGIIINSYIRTIKTMFWHFCVLSLRNRPQ